jgi:hypothetical protein
MWVRHLARVRDRKGAYRVLEGRPVRKNHLEDVGVDGRIILKCI